MNHRVLQYVLLTTVVLIHGILSTTVHGAMYYLAPTGADANAGTSPTAPWKTFAFVIPRLEPGDTLVLRDGTYNGTNSGFPRIDCSTNARNGTAAKPITIAAEYERKAFLQSDGSVDAFDIANCSYWKIIGLRIEAGDISQSPMGGGGPIWVLNSNHLQLKRLLLARSNRYFNIHLLFISRSNNILVEDSEFYYFHRHGILNYYSDNNIYRRNYFNSRGYADIPDGYGPTADPTRGEASIAVYPGSSNISENNISEGNNFACNVEASSTSDNNKCLGVISLNDNYGAVIRARGPTDRQIPHNTYLENLVVINPVVAGIYARSTKNTQCVNCSFLNGLKGGALADLDTGQMRDGIYSIFFTNTLVNNNRTSYGFHIMGQTTWRVDFSNAFGNSVNYSPSLPDARITNSLSADPKLGSCMVYIPPNSPMKGAGKNRVDIGANVLYRYENGVLTDKSLWNQLTGEFPCGALITGLNDKAGSSCFDVHKRLNVNANACSLPPGYSGKP